MKSSQCGVNMDVAQRTAGGGIRVPTTIMLRDYVDAKYDGLSDEEKRIVLHTSTQIRMQKGLR